MKEKYSYSYINTSHLTNTIVHYVLIIPRMIIDVILGKSTNLIFSTKTYEKI